MEKRGYKHYSICPYHRDAFMAALSCGFITNLYMFTNKISFHDDMVALFGVGTTYSSGRWLLGVLGDAVRKLYGNYSMPVLGGMISIFFIALSAAILVDVMEIHSKISSILAGAIMVVFPATCGVFAYMYTAPYYYFSLFITVAAVYFIKNGRWIGDIGGVILIACAMGIYQAYFPVAASALLSALIIKVISENIVPSKILKIGFHYVGLLLLSIILYLILTKWSLYIEGVQLNAHRGINNMAQTPLSQYPALMKAAYMRWWSFLVTINSISCSLLAKILFRIFTMLFISLVIIDSVIVFRKDYRNGLLLTGMFLLVPIAVNFMEIMAPGYVVERMMYGFVVAFLLLLALCEEPCMKDILFDWKTIKMYYIKAVRCMVIMVMAGFISVYVYYANVEYFRMDFIQSQAKSYFTTLITQIKSADGYKEDMPVSFIGEHSYVGLDSSFKGDYYNAVPYSSYVEVGDLINSYSWETFMRYWCGFAATVKDEEEYKKLLEVQAMNTYPNDGSIKIIDGVVVIKLSE